MRIASLHTKLPTEINPVVSSRQLTLRNEYGSSVAIRYISANVSKPTCRSIAAHRIFNLWVSILRNSIKLSICLNELGARSTNACELKNIFT